jgi:hypothetical protein
MIEYIFITIANMSLTATMLTQNCCAKAKPLLRLATGRYAPLFEKNNNTTIYITNLLLGKDICG